VTVDEYRENKQLIMARQNELEAKLATLETPIAPKQNRKKVDFGEIIRLIQDESVTTEQKATAIRKYLIILNGIVRNNSLLHFCLMI